jgi:hypothetical protein
MRQTKGYNFEKKIDRISENMLGRTENGPNIAGHLQLKARFL